MTDSSHDPDLPDIEDLEPEQWLSRIDQLHDQLLESIVEVLDEHDHPESAIELLDELFEAYHPDRRDTSERDRLVSVEITSSVALRCYRDDSSKSDVELTVGSDGQWRRIGEDVEGEANEKDEGAHEILARAMLQLVPWWSERAFVDQVGHPGAFKD